MQCSIQNSTELNSRLTKLQQVITETLWRFQIVKSELVQMEYGKVNNLYSNDLNTVKSISDRQENMVYELMKERRRRRSSASLGAITVSVLGTQNFADSLAHQNQSHLKRNESKSSLVKPRTLISNVQSNLSKPQSGSNNAQHYRNRSRESQRSLSLIYPMNKFKGTNLTIMKLLASIETLSTLCLKEQRFSEANQLVKMYASRKEANKSFEFREIIFYSVYQKTIDELNKIQKQQKQSGHEIVKKQRQNLIDLSMQSLDMAKITENLLSFVDKDDELLKCIFLCDTITISNVDLKVASNLIDYARIKLNQNLIGNNTNAAVLLTDKNKNENSSFSRKANQQNNLGNSSDSDENTDKSIKKFKRKSKSKI